jgi:uracil-DNA glycosylase
VHKTGIPWDDPSGRQLRKWLGVDDAAFYNPKNFALVPMGFCYPGKGKSGDLPPRKECAPQWHENLIKAMPSIQLTVVIGMYAQQHYLKEAVKKNLTETVKSYQDYLPGVIPLPHPSPRNRFWLTKNPWFEISVIPQLQLLVRSSLS